MWRSHLGDVPLADGRLVSLVHTTVEPLHSALIPRCSEELEVIFLTTILAKVFRTANSEFSNEHMLDQRVRFGFVEARFLS